MTYYRLQPSSDAKVIGNTFPQVQRLKSDLNVWDPRNLYCHWGKFPEDIYIPELFLHAKAKVTDYISSAVFSLHAVISDRLKNIIQPYRKQGLEFGATILLSRGKEIPYWVMNGYEMDYKYIDFSRSVVIKNRVGKKIAELDIQTAGGLEMAIEAMGDGPDRIWIEKMELVNDIADDIFFIDKYPGSNFYLSEKLKNEIEGAGCTGINFVKVE
jgi:hypothetical protein